MENALKVLGRKQQYLLLDDDDDEEEDDYIYSVYSLHVNILPTYIFMSTMYMPDFCGDLKRLSGPLEPELQVLEPQCRCWGCLSSAHSFIFI